MKKLILILFALPVLIACDNHVEQRTTVTEYEKERIRQAVADIHFRCWRANNMADCEYFQMTDFKIIRTSFEDWKFYEILCL